MFAQPAALKRPTPAARDHVFRSGIDMRDGQRRVVVSVAIAVYGTPVNQRVLGDVWEVLGCLAAIAQAVLADDAGVADPHGRHRRGSGARVGQAGPGGEEQGGVRLQDAVVALEVYQPTDAVKGW